MKTKTERTAFTFDKKTAELLDKLVKHTDFTRVKVVQRALEAYAKEKGVENE